MSETDRVQRWREAKRQKGLKPCTVWLTVDEELLLKDYAAKGRCPPSEIMQRALAQYQPAKQSSSSNVTDTELLREMIRTEIGAMKAEMAPVTATVTDTELLRALIQAELAQVPPVTALVTATVTDTVAAILPAMMRSMIQELELDAMGMPATATSNSYITDTDEHEETTESPHANIADTNGNVTETAQPAAAPRKGGRPTTIRPRIVDLLRGHPEGLTAMEIRVHLGVDRNLADVLQGMVRDHVIEKQGSGARACYRVPGVPPAPPTASPAAPLPARRKRQTQPA
ncbi:MAG TPA: hypothetical protein VLQ80_14825 [Candidatus Saccharimonadia bacterium]|nr:hypothetical protein [Candidatus Saccharimonadia bacterium]